MTHPHDNPTRAELQALDQRRADTLADALRPDPTTPRSAMALDLDAIEARHVAALPRCWGSERNGVRTTCGAEATWQCECSTFLCDAHYAEMLTRRVPYCGCAWSRVERPEGLVLVGEVRRLRAQVERYSGDLALGAAWGDRDREVIARLTHERDAALDQLAAVTADAVRAEQERAEAERARGNANARANHLATERDAATARADAAETECARLRRMIEHATPWKVSDPPTDEEMHALRMRWAFGPERYQADADALIAAVMHLRAQVATLTQERDEARADTASISADVDELRSQASRSVVVLVPIRNVFAAIRSAKHGGAIELPGGKVDEGESTLAAARREASEELGVPVSVNPCALGEFLHVFRGRLWRCEAFLGDIHGAHVTGSAEGEATYATRDELLAGTYGPVVRRILAAYDERLRERADVVSDTARRGEDRC